MKKFLPTIPFKLRGFTLVELLIVIAIIAVLAVIGFVILGGIPAKARDARRRADLEEISKAYEANYNASTNTYQALTPAQFANNVIPAPPEAPSYTCLVGPSGCNTTSTANYTVCATLEGGTPGCTATSATCFCKSGQQAATAVAAVSGCPAFNNTTSQFCSTVFSSASPNVGQCLATVFPIWIRCSELTANLNLVSNANCSAPGSVQLTGDLNYYGSDATGVAPTGTFRLYTSAACTAAGTRGTVNLRTTAP